MKGKSSHSQMKLYVKGKTADTGGDTTEFTVAVHNEKQSTSVTPGTNTPLDCNEINYWDFLTNELVEKIILRTKDSRHVKRTNSLSKCEKVSFTLRYFTHVP